jgi:hypothetical protein
MKELKVQFINFWVHPFNDRWLLNFIKHYFSNEFNIIEVKNKKKCDILISSVMGKLINCKKIEAKMKIFFYGENLNRFPEYKNINILKNNFDLILGFLPTDLNNKILRFPLWFMYYPFYDINDNNTNNIIDYINNENKKNKNLSKKILASCIARHDMGGIRSKISNEIGKYGKIAYPSKFRKNCNIGPEPIHKKNFLKNVKYNICPENSKFPGYHTEKIFQALESGCVPVYWGIDYAEKDIINKNSYIFVNINNENKMKEQIKNGIKNYENLLKENIFVENAKEITKKYYQDLYVFIKNYVY